MLTIDLLSTNEHIVNIYVGNLSFETTSDDLQSLFAAYGPVTAAKVVTDTYTGKCKGFGFVEMESKPEASKAILELNGKDVKGRSLTVNEARPRPDRDGNRGGTPGAFGGGRQRG